MQEYDRVISKLLQNSYYNQDLRYGQTQNKEKAT